MANEAHLAEVEQGAVAWNAWRKANLYIRPDLSGADLIGADLRGANLGGAYLRGAYLQRADLQGAYLREADLRDADLREAYLRADLQGAYLREADLRRASLREANLSGANLREADLAYASIQYTVFADNDLSDVHGLDTVKHHGPSTIGIDTLQRSGNTIPDAFLRGCGVPDSWIEYLPSLMGALQPIQFYSCFISYSHQDEAFAQRLHSRMQQEHLRVWYASEDLRAGQKLDEQIDQAIRVYDKLILILSHTSLHSKWVIRELGKGRNAELARNRRKLFPIRLVDMKVIDDWACYDPEIAQDLATEVRQYYIPDFAHWKDHDTFESGFTKLLESLKAVDEVPAPRDRSGLIEKKKRELRALETQQASMGNHTPVHIVIAIEDLHNEIAALQQQPDEATGKDPQL